MTGAVKNMFGCLPGGYKQKIHLWTGTYSELADVFLDIINIVKPVLYIMDAVIALDGGPSAIGKPVSVGAILSSTNPAALDYAASKIIGYEPEEVSTLVRAKERGVISDYNTVEIIGELPDTRFKKIKKGPIPEKVEGIFINETYVYPRIKSRKCSKCAECLKFCPVNAFIKKDRFYIDYEKCIHCYYCLSACPENAIGIRSSLKNKFIRFLRLLLRI
jgi:ferredoxin